MYLSEVLTFMATAMVHVRVDERVKERAAKTLAAMGMSVSDAVRILLLRVAAEKALPFEVRVQCNYSEGDGRSGPRRGQALQVCPRAV